MTNPLLWLFSPEEPLIDLGDNLAFGDTLVALESLATPAASTDPDYPWAWLTSPYWPAGATRHDVDNGLTHPGLFPHTTAAVTSDELDFPFAWVLKKSNVPGNVFHDPGNGIFIRPLFPSVVVTTGQTIIELAATVAGTSTVTADLDQIEELASTPAGTSTVTAALTNLALRELAGTPAGTSSVTAALLVIRQLTATITGTPTITGALDPILDATATGTATVTASLTNERVTNSGFEIPYLLGWGGKHVVELQAQSWGRPTVTGILAKLLEITATVAGTSTVTANLFASAGTGFLAGTITGTSTVTGRLQNFDGINIELAGTIAGTSTVGDAEFENIPRQQPRFLYQYINVGVGFDTYDDPSARSDFVAFTAPDGQNNPSLLTQNLYQYINVGVGFDDYDTYPGAVAQTFPDGHNRDDFARYLYQYINVIKGRKGYGRLAILPSYADKHEFVPNPKPPSNELG